MKKLTIASVAYGIHVTDTDEFHIYDDSDMYGVWFDEWVNEWRSIASSVEKECPESHDSTEVWTFADGSSLRVCNPAQAAFRASVYLLED